MIKNKIVVFNDSCVGARINVRCGEHEFKKSKLVLINPDLSEVQGISPELWVLRNGKITRADLPVVKQSFVQKITSFLKRILRRQ